MNTFISEHPWMFFWLIVIVVVIIDNMIGNVCKARKAASRYGKAVDADTQELKRQLAWMRSLHSQACADIEAIGAKHREAEEQLIVKQKLIDMHEAELSRLNALVNHCAGWEPGHVKA